LGDATRGNSEASARLASLEDGVDLLARDELLAFPTETVWGLGACATSTRAVGRLQEFKGRASDQPISVLVDGPSRLEQLGFALAADARRVLDAFWPGPLTVVLAGSGPSAFAEGIGGARGAVGFRCSDHPCCRALVEAAFERGLGPITATSFNRTGEPPVQTRAEALGLAGSSAEPRVYCLDPGPDDALAEAPSTVVDLSVRPPRVLRWGAIRQTALQPVLPDLE
jgi:L-threonylcarbamoyladenylate synthase